MLIGSTILRPLSTWPKSSSRSPSCHRVWLSPKKQLIQGEEIRYIDWLFP